MNCIICKTSCFIGHHVCYDPEISVPVCWQCHTEIHHGRYFYLDPTRMSRDRGYYIWRGDTLVHTPTGEVIEIPHYLCRYVQFALNSRALNRQQMYQRWTKDPLL